MKMHTNLVHLTAIATLAFALPASAQLLGGSGSGALGGTLSGGTLNGGLQGGAMGGGQFGGGLMDSAGGVRDTTAGAAGSARGTVQDKAGRTREAAGNVAGRTRDAGSNGVNGIRNAPKGSFMGNVAGGASATVNKTTEAPAPAADQSPVDGASPAQTRAAPVSNDGVALGSTLGGNASAERNGHSGEAGMNEQGSGRASRDGISADSNVSGNAKATRTASTETSTGQP